jgi:hypothetical protein
MKEIYKWLKNKINYRTNINVWDLSIFRINVICRIEQKRYKKEIIDIKIKAAVDEIKNK